MKPELIGMNKTELEDYLESMKEQRFRGRQVYRWLYCREVGSIDEMTDLPLRVRELLIKTTSLSIPTVLEQRTSEDGTSKLLLQLQDGRTVEMVLIPQARSTDIRYTACISSQVGCPVGCSFCATGVGGFERSLEVHEIVGQIVIAKKIIKLSSGPLHKHKTKKLTNVVFMGMGEPFFNYRPVIKSIRLFTDTEGLNIGQRHITISTAGEANGIKRLAEEELQVTLAVSLHAARDELRNNLVPLNRKYPLSELQEAIKTYTVRTGRRVTLEYILLNGVNTTREDARELISFAQPLLVNVNLIPYNEVSQTGFKRPPGNVISQFKHWLASAGINAVLREERGSDIEAACGQLRAQKAGTSRRKTHYCGRKHL